MALRPRRQMSSTPSSDSETLNGNLSVPPYPSALKENAVDIVSTTTNQSISSIIVDDSQDYASELSSYCAQSAISEIWNCPAQNNQNTTYDKKKKFVFIHVYKTAGSTIRNLFQEYTSLCLAHPRRFARVVDCRSMERVDDDEQLKPDYDPNEDWSTCDLKVRGEGQKRGNDAAVANDFDTLGGHWRIGAVDHLQEYSFDYVTFVRNAAQKYVSHWVYKNKFKEGDNRLDQEQLEAVIRRTVIEELSRGQYDETYKYYLLTPEQHRFSIRRAWNYETKTKLMKENLVKYNVTMGVVESMTESLDLIQYRLDRNGKVDSLFEEYGVPVTKNSTKVTNISPISSSAILRNLEEDPEFYLKLLEYVKYEQEVTDFGVALHQEQYKAMTLLKQPQQTNDGELAVPPIIDLEM